MNLACDYRNYFLTVQIKSWLIWPHILWYGPVSDGLISYRLYDMVPYHIISLEKLDQSPSQVRQNPKNYNFWKSWFWLFGHGCLRRTVVRPGQRLEHDFGKIEGVTICHKFCHIARLNRSWRTNLPGFGPWAPEI